MMRPLGSHIQLRASVLLKFYPRPRFIYLHKLSRPRQLHVASQQLQLRPFQEEAVSAVTEAWARGCNRQLVSLPTGSGKTVIFCHLARALNKRTLILAHRVELLQQTADKMRLIWPEARVGMLNRRNRQYDAQVVIASVQTAYRRNNLDRLMQQGFEVVIVDEAHHAPASSYTEIFESLQFLDTSEASDSQGSSSSSDEAGSPADSSVGGSSGRGNGKGGGLPLPPVSGVVDGSLPTSEASVHQPDSLSPVVAAGSSLNSLSSSSSNDSGSSSDPPPPRKLRKGARAVAATAAVQAAPAEHAAAAPAAAHAEHAEPGSCTAVASEQLASEVEDLLELEAPTLLGLAGERLLVGFTATPFRLDKKRLLGDIFQEIVYQRDLVFMVRQGYLVPPMGYRVITDEDLSSASVSQGDFKEAELEELVNTPQRNALAAKAYSSLAPGRRAVVFCVSVQHSLDMAAAFREAGLSCEAVHSKLTQSQREEVLRRFAAGEIQVLSNCMILSEGYDETSIGCVLMARPTKSAGLYTQCIGRGLRRHEGKGDCIVIDMTDRHHDIATVASLAMVYPEEGSGGEGMPGNLAPGPKEAKVRLNAAVPRGRLDFMARKYTWSRFPGTAHFVLSLFTPSSSPGESKWGGQKYQKGGDRGPQWCIWLVALEQLQQQQPPGQNTGAAQQQEEQGLDAGAVQQPPEQAEQGHQPSVEQHAEQQAAVPEALQSPESSAATAAPEGPSMSLPGKRGKKARAKQQQGEAQKDSLNSSSSSSSSSSAGSDCTPSSTQVNSAGGSSSEGVEMQLAGKRAAKINTVHGTADGTAVGIADGTAAAGSQRYLAFVMCKEARQAATWQLAGPDAGKQARQEPPRALPLEAAVSWAEHLIESGFKQHASRNLADAPWRLKPASDKQLFALGRMLEAGQQQQPEEQQQQDGAEGNGTQGFAGGQDGARPGDVGGEGFSGNTLEGLKSGEASDLISVLKLLRWYNEGLIRFPTIYSG